MSAPVADLMAVAICDAFFAAAVPPDPRRWPAANLDQRRTFQACAEAALEAGRRVQREQLPSLELAVGEAISGAFWAGVPSPPHWLTWRNSPPAREVFLVMARAAIDAGRRTRAARTQAAA